MSDTVTTYTAALKEYYSPDQVRNLQFKNNPFFQLVKKDNNFAGKPYYRIPVVWGAAAGTSSTFADAQAGALATSSQVGEFQVSRTKTFQVAYIDGDLILASEGKTAAFLDAATLVSDNAILSLSRDIAIGMYEDGYGARARLSHTSSVSTATVTLSRVSDAKRFEVGQMLDFSAAKGSGAAKKAYGSSGNALKITAIDRKAGTLTFGYNVNDATNGVPTIAVDDYVYLKGDVTTTRTKICGLSGWLDETPSGSESFFGLDRSQDSSRLAGLKYDATGGVPVLEALEDGSQLVGEYGGKASHAFMSYSQYSGVIKALGSKVVYTDHGKGQTGFRGVEVVTPQGTIDCVPDVNCPDTRIYMLELDSWKLCSLKDPVHQINEDGLTLRAYASDDKFEMRWRNSGNLGCMAPSHNVSIQLA